MQSADLQGVTLHTLRHSFASVADDLGLTLATTGALLGHSAGSVTHRYVHKLDAALIAAADSVAAAIHKDMSKGGAHVNRAQGCWKLTAQRRSSIARG
jgi:integrase